MQGTVEKIIRRYGNEMVLVQNGKQTTVRAFLQETRSRSQEYAQREFSPLGEICRGLYVYIGPAEPLAEMGDRIRFGDRRFEVRRAEAVKVNDKTLYCWGLCVERGADS